MHRQGNLFNSFGRSYAKQGGLFDSGPRVSALSCGECGAPMEETPSGFICCPNGHGKLSVEAPEVHDTEANGSWFDE